MPGTFRSYSNGLHYESAFWSAMCTEKLAWSLLVKEKHKELLSEKRLCSHYMLQHGFTYYENFPLQFSFWVQCSCKVQDENIHDLQDSFTTIWTSDCLNVKQTTFHCFRKTVRLMLLKREAQELQSWKAGLGSCRLRGLVPLVLCLLASLSWFWIKESLIIEAVCSRVLVNQKKRPKPQFSIQFTHLPVKWNTSVFTDNPWGAGLDTHQRCWFLGRCLVLGNIGHTIVD